MTSVGIMQPYLFPYIGYYQLMNAVDTYVIYDDVQFIKGGWINRNNLLVQGNKTLFSIQLDHASANKLINEIDISDDFSRLLKTLSFAYARAPFVHEVMDMVKRICVFDDRNLARFVGNSIEEVAQYIGIETTFVYASTLKKDNALKGQQKVLNMCELLGATEYINAEGGQELYDKVVFREHGIELRFLKAHMPPYKQSKTEFVPGLSILDILMFNSPADTRKMLEDYELI